MVPRSIVREGTCRLLRYFITKKLSGDITRLQVAYDYLVKGMSPSDISRRYGVSKCSVSATVRKVIDTVGKEWIARWVVKTFYKRIMGVDPIIMVINRGRSSTYYCILCSREVTDPLTHVRTRHTDIVDRMLRAVIRGVNL